MACADVTFGCTSAVRISGVRDVTRKLLIVVKVIRTWWTHGQIQKVYKHACAKHKCTASATVSYTAGPAMNKLTETKVLLKASPLV